MIALISKDYRIKGFLRKEKHSTPVLLAHVREEQIFAILKATLSSLNVCYCCLMFLEMTNGSIKLLKGISGRNIPPVVQGVLGFTSVNPVGSVQFLHDSCLYNVINLK